MIVPSTPEQLSNKAAGTTADSLTSRDADGDLDQDMTPRANSRMTLWSAPTLGKQLETLATPQTEVPGDILRSPFSLRAETITVKPHKGKQKVQAATLGPPPSDAEGSNARKLVTDSKVDRRRKNLEKQAAKGDKGLLNLDDESGKNDSTTERSYRRPTVQAGLRPIGSKRA